MFADTDSELWGVVWGGTVGTLGCGTLRDALARSGCEASVEAADERSGEWRVTSAAGELAVAAIGDAPASSLHDGFSQLCQVQGRVALDGTERELHALGIRELRAQAAIERLDSVRTACAWFDRDEGAALTALRPAGAAGHDRDIVTAAVFEPGTSRAVVDPRLSTTYAADGRPARVGLELWLESEDEDAEYPWRATGQVLGAAINLAADGVEVKAQAMRWQNRGRQGPGAYLFARPR